MKGLVMNVMVLLAICLGLTYGHNNEAPGFTKEDLYCPPNETGEIILYPNSENCSEFFQCAYGYLYTHVCGPGLYYCAAMEYCDYPNHCDFSNCKMNPTKEHTIQPRNPPKQNMQQVHKTEKEDLYCPPNETGEIILYPNPENCSEFFQCAYGYLYTHVCGPGLYYCAAMEYCDYPNHCDFSNCKMNPTKEHTIQPRNPPKQNMQQVHKTEKEDLYCPPNETGEIILYPNPENCSEFFQCAYGYLYTHVCGPGLYYCAAMEYCDYPNHCDFSNCKMNPTKEHTIQPRNPPKQNMQQVHKTEKEDLYCPPNETGEIILYPNPENCSEFFQCAYGYLYTHVCGPGLYYCAAMEYCDYPNHCDFSNCKMNPTKEQTIQPRNPPKQNMQQVHKTEKEDLYCPPNETGEIILYPNPENCSEFIQCAYGYLYTHVCGPGLYYCAAMEYCDYPNHCDFSNCKMNPTKEQTIQPRNPPKQNMPQDHKTEKEDLYCPPNETGEIILYPNPENCSEFIQCAYGYLYTHVCGSGLYYCAAREYCDYPNDCDYSNCQMYPSLKNQKPVLRKLPKLKVNQFRNMMKNLFLVPEMK